MKCLLIYDIPNDRVRTKVADFCLDYGLDRVQYSAFVGDLSANHQEELLLKIGDKLGKAAGRIDLFAFCKEDWNRRQNICQGMDDKLGAVQGAGSSQASTQHEEETSES